MTTLRLTVDQLRRLQAARPKVKRKKKPTRREDPLHVSIRKHLETVLPLSWVVHHSRNGGKSKAENGRAKAMGTKAGWPDLEVAGNLDGHPFLLLLEVKTDDGYVEPHQRKMHDKLRALGFSVHVVRSIEDTRQVLQALAIPTREARQWPPTSPSSTPAPASA